MKFFLIGAASWLAVACQPQARTEPTGAARRPGSVAGRAAAAPAEAPAPGGALAAFESLPPVLQSLVREHDLVPLLQTVTASNAHAQNGFFGPEHRRIELVFTEVRRDPSQSNRYYLRGKDRYKGRIVPFVGTISLLRFGQQPANTAYKRVRTYSAEGRFELREDSTYAGAGMFQGRVNIDYLLENGVLYVESECEQMPSRGGGIKYEGTWTSGRTHRATPVVWVEDIIRYGNENKVLPEFGFVERHPYFNPKYARLGWDNYWQNDEWWADAKRKTAAAAANATDASPGPGI